MSPDEAHASPAKVFKMTSPMHVKELTISGYRGFAGAASIQFALPDGRQPASGLTVLVGANNAGKSAILECLRLFSSPQGVSITEGRRNSAAGGKVRLALEYASGDTEELTTVPEGGSELVRSPGGAALYGQILCLPARRYFRPRFSKAPGSRGGYAAQLQSNAARGEPIDSFATRPFEIAKDRGGFDAVLTRLLGRAPEWVIELGDDGSHYLKMSAPSGTHSSDGIGDGLVSIFFLADALYDSDPTSVVVIDEPELSLHPALQKRVSDTLTEFATHRQIIIATHSPYFVPIEALGSGIRIARVSHSPGGAHIHALQAATGAQLLGLTRDTHNPHTLGLEAREVFFLEDGVILVEGQEDVIYYRKLAEHFSASFPFPFFGWGTGGASKMRVVCRALHELGYRRVVGIVDGDQDSEREKLTREFTDYRFVGLPFEDIRSKPAIQQVAKVGLFDARGQLSLENAEVGRRLLDQVFEACLDGV